VLVLCSRDVKHSNGIYGKHRARTDKGYAQTKGTLRPEGQEDHDCLSRASYTVTCRLPLLKSPLPYSAASAWSSSSAFTGDRLPPLLGVGSIGSKTSSARLAALTIVPTACRVALEASLRVCAASAAAIPGRCGPRVRRGQAHSVQCGDRAGVAVHAHYRGCKLAQVPGAHTAVAAARVHLRAHVCIAGVSCASMCFVRVCMRVQLYNMRVLMYTCNAVQSHA